MAAETSVTPLDTPGRTPIIGRSVFAIATRYLLRKPLSYLAILGIMLSVGTLIVVMSVFTGFHDRMVGAIRGYRSDLIVRPDRSRLYGMENWQIWRDMVLSAEHVEGAAPFIEGFALVRLPYDERMEHVFLRGIEPELEPTVSDLNEFMVVSGLGALTERRQTNAADGSLVELPSAFVGRQFPGFRSRDAEAEPPYWLEASPARIILMTATPELDRRLASFAVAGMFQTNHIDYDSQVAVLDLATAQSFVGAGRAVSGLSVRLDDYDEHGQDARAALADSLRPGASLRTFETENALAAALSADGTRMAVIDADGASVREVGSGETLLVLPAAAPEPTAVALDPRGDYLLVGRQDGSAAVIEIASEKELFRTPAQQAPATAACFSPDGLLAALAFESGVVCVHDSGSGEEVASLSGHSGRVNSIAFDPRSERVVTAGQDGTARVWDAAEGTLLARLEVGSPVGAGAFSHDGHLIATGDEGGELNMWLPNGTHVLRWATPSGEAVHAVSFGWRADTVAAASGDAVRLWGFTRNEALFGRPGSVEPQMLWESRGSKLRCTPFAERARYALTLGADGATLLYAGPGFEVETWQEQAGVLLEAVAMERFMMVLIVSLILVVAEFLIFTIVSTMVAERRRDIGILKAIGFTRGQICKVFLAVGLAVGLLGAALGVAGGLLFTANINAVRVFLREAIGFDPFPPQIYYFKDIPTHTGWLTVVLVTAGAVLCSLIFSLLPALRAARMDPVRTLHSE